MSETTFQQGSPRNQRADLYWYMSNMGLYFTCVGIGGVLTPWLAAIVLQESAQVVGFVQAMVLLPMMFLLPFGGAKADRSELRSWLAKINLMQIVPPLALAALMFSGQLHYIHVIFYGMAAACIGSFAGPTRDSLLTRVASQGGLKDMQQAVGIAVAVQTGAQFAGLLYAGQVANVGNLLFSVLESYQVAVPVTPLVLGGLTLPLLMAVNYFICSFLIRQVSPMPREGLSERGGKSPGAVFRDQLNDIVDGFKLAWQSERIRSVTTMVFFSSMLLMGVVMVMLPLMVRDVYGGGAAEISIQMLCFNAGIGIASVIVAHRPVLRQGRALMLSYFGGVFGLLALHMAPPLWGYYVIIFLWGMAGGVSQSMARTIVQTAAPESHLARVLSVFTAVLLIGGPVGSFATGQVVGALGVLDATLVPATLMAIVWVAILVFTPLWKLKSISALDD